MPEFPGALRNAGDKQTIKTIEDGEEAIKALGFRQFRVRFHGELVRIEIAPKKCQKR